MLEKEWNENVHDPSFPVCPFHLNIFFSNYYTVASSYTHTYTLTTANAVPFSVAKRNNKTITLKISIIDPL